MGAALCAARGKQLAQRGCHHGCDAHETWHARGQQLGCPGEYVGELFDFASPAARQHREHAVRGADAEFGARRSAIDFERNLVGERMPYECGTTPCSR